MAFTVVAYSDAVAHASLSPVSAVADPHVQVSGTEIYVPQWNKLLGAIAGGGAMSEAQLQSPSLRRMLNQRITPVAKQSLPLTRQSVNEGGTATYDVSETNPEMFYQDWRDIGRVLTIAEALEFYAVNGSATREWGILWLYDSLEALPGGEIITIKGTASPSLSAATWSNASISFEDTLPSGRYAVVGARIEDPNVVAGRFVFTEFPHRPGVLANEDTDTGDISVFRKGALGSFGEFEHNSPPTMDFLGNATASPTVEVLLDLVQVRAGR